MVIAAHIYSTYLPSSQLFQALRLLAIENTSLQVYIFCDEDDLEKDGYYNIEFIDVKPAAKSNLRLHYWYNFKLPALLKKIKADVFLSDAGVCSLKNTIPQWIVINNINFLYKKPVIKFKIDAYLRKYLPKISPAAAGVLVRQQYMGEQISSRYNIPQKKIHLLGEYFFDLYKPMQWEAKNDLLENVTAGIEYFLCVGTPATKNNITEIFKAFSLFKKRLKSSLKLVLTLQDVTLEECVKEFRLYKYREDVIVVDQFVQFTYPQLVAASYAVIYMPSQITGYSERGLSAMQSGTALIAVDAPEHESLYKDVALLSDVNDKSIADNMMLLYKDEALRNRCIEKGLELTKDCNVPALSEQISQIISRSRH